ncbi:MAG: hypothetical protein ACKVI6_05715 [Candidatus Poseidoniales archaeon]|jgi:hypothetical protein|tara:strand:- start:11257 stop:11610 length:354 start_codon:yes stop_codon:yes gene_type:complete
MVKSMLITKTSIRARLIIDAEVQMHNPSDYDFSPRADIEGNVLQLRNEGDTNPATTVELDQEQMIIVERDRLVELRVKFSVQGMHGVLTAKTKVVRDGPNSKKLAEPRWKTVLPLVM